MQLGFNHQDTKALSQNDFLAIRLEFFSQSKLSSRARTQWSQPVYSWCLCAFVFKNLFSNCTIRVNGKNGPASSRVWASRRPPGRHIPAIRHHPRLKPGQILHPDRTPNLPPPPPPRHLTAACLPAYNNSLRLQTGATFFRAGPARVDPAFSGWKPEPLSRVFILPPGWGKEQGACPRAGAKRS